ncbi:hypothetical protein [Mycoplasma sp. P36-A1]|uniref:hypothetical protein n=1 Tax=Mycoplasma sp. P36-A1 TaxID=3252900 RepID=UPI003C2D4D20
MKTIKYTRTIMIFIALFLLISSNNVINMPNRNLFHNTLTIKNNIININKYTPLNDLNKQGLEIKKMSEYNKIKAKRFKIINAAFIICTLLTIFLLNRVFSKYSSDYK